MPETISKLLYRALVVEDEAEILRTVVRYLERMGISSQTATDGSQALRILEREKFDIIITDLRMPGMHGHALVKEISNRYRHQLIVVMTGIDEFHLVYDLLVRGVKYVLLKPFNYDYFSAVIGGLLEQSQRERRLKEISLAQMKSLITDQMKSTARSLTTQLETIQEHFQRTIRQLEEEQIDLERDYLGSVRMMAELMDYAHIGGSSHAARVEDLARRVGERVGLSAADMRDLSLVCLMHDIGKFSLPERLINLRPEQMTENEMLLYRRHPVIGGLLVSSVPGLGGIGAIIEEHHENYDGSGFPRGKVGSDLVVSSRILRIADGVDRFLETLNSERVSLSQAAKEHLHQGAGRLYDPHLARLMLSALMEKEQEQETFVIVDLKPEELRPGMKLAQDI
ncbi:MAG: HD domain-containing phosphohydrolase, partial [bacterium]